MYSNVIKRTLCGAGMRKIFFSVLVHPHCFIYGAVDEEFELVRGETSKTKGSILLRYYYTKNDVNKLGTRFHILFEKQNKYFA